MTAPPRTTTQARRPLHALPVRRASDYAVRTGAPPPPEPMVCILCGATCSVDRLRSLIRDVCDPCFQADPAVGLPLALLGVHVHFSAAFRPGFSRGPLGTIVPDLPRSCPVCGEDARGEPVLLHPESHLVARIHPWCRAPAGPDCGPAGEDRR